MKLKLRKRIELRVDNLDKQTFNLETQIMTLDDTLMNINTIEV